MNQALRLLYLDMDVPETEGALAFIRIHIHPTNLLLNRVYSGASKPWISGDHIGYNNNDLRK